MIVGYCTGKRDSATTQEFMADLRERVIGAPEISTDGFTTVAQKLTDHAWSIGELIDAALATQPIDPVVAAPDRRRAFRVIDGGKNN
jgi:hypothetical protein